jgi:hypothetical protein
MLTDLPLPLKVELAAYAFGAAGVLIGLFALVMP